MVRGKIKRSWFEFDLYFGIICVSWRTHQIRKDRKRHETGMFNITITVLTLCERIDEEAMEDLDEDVQVEGNCLKDIRFANRYEVCRRSRYGSRH